MSIPVLIAAFVIVGATSPPSPAQKHGTAWKKCSIARGDAAAREAGIWHAVDRDPMLRRTFSETRSTRSVYGRPSGSLCGDFNGDGRLDRAVHYQCCTVSSPAPWVVLRRRAGRWRIVFKRLHDTTWQLLGDGTDLVTVEPKYDFKHDALCCPSHLRVGTLKWTGSGFRRLFRITDPDADPVPSRAPSPPPSETSSNETQPPGRR